MDQDWSALLQQDLAQLTEVVAEHPTLTERLIPGERREVAILFLDLKGFTALSETMDHEMVHKMIGGVMQALARVVEGFGGYVDKFEGDLIMALFGARQASENDANRAVGCGLKLLATLTEVNRILASKGFELGARVGINFGSVTVAPDPSGHLTAMGDEVNLASRMESSAAINTVQATDRVYRKCGSEFEWLDLGTISVKGKREPIHTYRPVGPGTQQMARWERATHLPHASFCGRDSELQTLSNWWNTPHPDSKNRLGGAIHRVMVIAGEAGIGKSRLFHEFLGSPAKRPIHAIRSQAITFAQPAFHCWIEILHNILQIDRANLIVHNNLKAKLEQALPDWSGSDKAEYLPYLGALLSIAEFEKSIVSIDQVTRYQTTIRALRAVIQHYIAKHPETLILFENFHDLDSASLDALGFILTNCITANPISIVLIGRDENETAKKLLDSIPTGYIDVQRLDLSPLSKPVCEQIVSEMLQLPQHAAESAAISSTEFFSISGGNPLFLEELILDAVEAGRLEQSPSGWREVATASERAVPSSLDGLIRGRIDRLAIEWKQGLQLAAILGTEFSERLWLRVNEKSNSSLTDQILSNLVGMNLLLRMDSKEKCRYRFEQPLIRTSTYSTILKHNRAILHRYAAEAMLERKSELSDADSIALASHWEHTDNRAEAIHWSLEALHYHVRNYQHREAIAWSDKLLAWLHDESDTERTASRLQQVLHHRFRIFSITGDTTLERDAIDQSLALAEKWQWEEITADVLNSLGNHLDLQGKTSESIEVFNRALAIFRKFDNHHGCAEVLNNLGTIHLFENQFDQALSLFEQALAIFHESHDRKQEGIVLNNIGIVYRKQNHRQEALDILQSATQVAHEIDDRKTEAQAFTNIGNLQYDLDHKSEAVDAFRKALAIDREIGDRRSEALVMSNLGYLYLENREFREAEQLFTGSLYIARETQSAWSELQAMLNLVQLYIDTDNRAKAVEFYRKVLNLIEAMGWDPTKIEDFSTVTAQIEQWK